MFFVISLNSFFSNSLLYYNIVYDFCLLFLSFIACLILVKLGYEYLRSTNTEGIRIRTVFVYRRYTNTDGTLKVFEYLRSTNTEGIRILTVYEYLRFTNTLGLRIIPLMGLMTMG